MPRWLTDEQQRVWRLFLGATRHLHAELERQLQSDAGMPHAYYQILAMLSEAPERSRRMSELARLVDASPSRLSHAMNRLEQEGWVERRRCDGDRRGIYAQLTDDGYQVLVEAAPGHVEAVLQSLFDRLTPSQVVELGRISEAVLEER